jgi:tetratricopeptide (TPR) repeat protein
VTPANRVRRLREAVAANPNDAASRLLLARFLEADGDLAGALAQYDEVLTLDPGSAEAEAQAGRIVYLTARAAVRTNPDQAADLVARARARLDHAVTLDPEYADARYFRAIVSANEFQDWAGAQNDLQRYLVLAPNGTFVVQARDLLARVTQIIDPTSATSQPEASKQPNKEK